MCWQIRILNEKARFFFLLSFCAKASISKVSFPSSALSTRRFLNLQARRAPCCFCEHTKQCFRCVVKATDPEREDAIDSPVAFHLRNRQLHAEPYITGFGARRLTHSLELNL